ncbi:MAG TPA: glycosyltransferase family 2 protein [Polyangiaceae bacterium]|nr:glycosyltransferase family 2 protein [Polyangiaceae bacterium]
MTDSSPPVPAFSVITVNWNSRADLEECLTSLVAQSARDFEVIVVDNGSTDGSLEMVREKFPGVRLLSTGENLGFAEANNRGIALARAAWVMTLNNDACARPDWAAQLLRAIASADERVGMIQCQMLFKSDTARLNSTGIIMFANGTARDRSFGEPVEAGAEPTAIFCPTAGAALYRKRMLEETRSSRGVFDRAYFMYCEDLDLGWRCRLAGYEALYWPAAVVEHAFQASSKRVASDFVEWHCRKNRAATLIKNASPGFLLRSLPRTIQDVVWVLSRRGFAGLDRYFTELASAAELRREVESVRRVERAEVERRWVGR